MGLVIESPELAAQIAAAFADEIPGRSYRVSLSKQGRLQWSEQREEGTAVFKTEPGATWLKRLGVRLMALLPIDWLL
jgi:putative cardiolipin synthase